MKKLLLSLLALTHIIALQAMTPSPERMYQELAAMNQAFTLKIVPFDEQAHGAYIRDSFKKSFNNNSFDTMTAIINPKPTIEILLANDKPVGSVIYHDYHPTKRIIDHVMIDEAYRGLRYGIYLMNQKQKQARDLGIKIMTLLSTRDSVSFYEKLDFIKERPGSFYLYKYLTSDHSTPILFHNHINVIFDN
jgi:predicted GNAT family acetyltransferase